MNAHRYRTAQRLADVVPVFVYRQPRAVLPWRATTVLPDTVNGLHTRLSAPGFTRSHAERRVRREVLRHVLAGWWGS